MTGPADIDYLSVDDLLEIAAGVVGEVRIRDIGLLASAAARPATTVAWSAAHAFCLLNGRDLRHTVDDAEAFVLAVAAGDRDVPEITTWIQARLART